MYACQQSEQKRWPHFSASTFGGSTSQQMGHSKGSCDVCEEVAEKDAEDAALRDDRVKKPPLFGGGLLGSGFGRGGGTVRPELMATVSGSSRYLSMSWSLFHRKSLRRICAGSRWETQVSRAEKWQGGCGKEFKSWIGVILTSRPSIDTMRSMSASIVCSTWAVESVAYSMSYDFGRSFSATTSKSIASSTRSANNRRSQRRVSEEGRVHALFVVFLLSHLDVALRVVVGVFIVVFVTHP